MTTFNQQETALFLANGDYWLSIKDDSTAGTLDAQLAVLIEKADDEVPADLYGTMPDNTVVCIGTSPRRPRKP